MQFYVLGSFIVQCQSPTIAVDFKLFLIGTARSKVACKAAENIKADTQGIILSYLCNYFKNLFLEKGLPRAHSSLLTALSISWISPAS